MEYYWMVLSSIWAWFWDIITINIFTSPNPSLRFGLDLCLDEKQFLSDRKCRISDGITALLGTDRGSKNANEVLTLSSLNFHYSKVYCYDVKLFLIDSLIFFHSFQCPRICLMTSGGGFRAMIAYCGAYKAMHDAGIMDTVTYISALSGSSW